MKKLISKISVLLGIAILFGLGIWQLFRMSDKEALLADLKVKKEMPIASPYEIDEEYLYRIVEICGYYKKGKDLFVYNKPNYILMAPFYIENSGRKILVARGQVTPKNKDNKSFLIQNENQICIAGMLVPSEKEPLFMPHYDGSPQKPLLTANTKSASSLLNTDLYDMFIILSDKSPAPDLIPIKMPEPKNIYNNHLEYAITWFILAGILIFMYVTSGRNNDRKN